MIGFVCRVETLQYLETGVFSVLHKSIIATLYTGNERKKKFKEQILHDRSGMCFYVTTPLLLLSFFHKTCFLCVMSDNAKDWHREERLEKRHATVPQ